MALPVLYLLAVTCRCKTNSRLKFTSRGLPAEVYQQRFTSIYLPVVKCHRGLLLAVVLPVFNFLHVRIISEIFQIWVCLSTLNLQCISYDRCTVLRLTIIKAFLKIHSNFLGQAAHYWPKNCMIFSSFYKRLKNQLFCSRGSHSDWKKFHLLPKKCTFPAYPNSNQGVICQLLLKHSTTFLV